jgi:hypothetical protein
VCVYSPAGRAQGDAAGGGYNYYANDASFMGAAHTGDTSLGRWESFGSSNLGALANHDDYAL